MRSIILFKIVVLSLLLISCNEDIDPVGNIRESYILYSILNGRDSSQVAVLTRNFSENGKTPENISVNDADVRIWVGDSVYTFTEELVNSESEQGLPIKTFYRSRKFMLEQFDETIEIEALLKNGKRITGISKTPSFIYFDKEVSVTSIPNDKEFFRFQWSGETNQQFFARLNINYKSTLSGVNILQVEVPVKINSSNELIYGQPEKSNALIIQRSALDYAMDVISEGDEIKSNYTVFDAELEILVFDDNLGSYYTSTHKELDAFSVQVDQIDYSNINGGFGVFGSILKVGESIKIVRSYIESFGYKAGIPD